MHSSVSTSFVLTHFILNQLTLRSKVILWGKDSEMEIIKAHQQISVRRNLLVSVFCSLFPQTILPVWPKFSSTRGCDLEESLRP
jgi:hypothetical protein